MSNNLNTKKNEIEKILERFNKNEKHIIQEYLSRSIVGNYYLKPQGYKHTTHYTYTNYQFQHWDIELTKSYSVIEVKEREDTHEDGFFLEDYKYKKLLFTEKPYYINYTLDDNKVYRWDLKNKVKPLIDSGDIKLELVWVNKNTMISREEKIEKPMYKLPISIATDVYTANTTQFVDVKLDLLKYLIANPTKLNNILKNIEDNETL